MAESDLATFLVSADEALDEAQDLLAASLAYYRRIGDETNVATVLNNLAGVAIARGDADQARRYLQESLETARRVEAVYQTSYAAGSLGFLSLREGDKATALQRYREALDVALEFGAAGGILSGIEGIALSASSVDPHGAARLLGAVQAIRAEHELRLDPIEEATFERLIEAIRCDLGEDVFDEEASSGAASLSIEHAATLALELSGRSTWYVRHVALDSGRSSTWTSGVGVARMVGAIAADARELWPAPVVLEGEYGVEGVALSVPVCSGGRGR